jgi:hypothetical protein
MKKHLVLFLCLLVFSAMTGCVVGVQTEPIAVYRPAPAYVEPAPAQEPVASVESPGMGQVGEAPPPIDIAEPEMVVVPSGNEYVYMVPNVAGVYFYGGSWYRYYGGGWYSATVWGGPWVGIGVAPGVVVAIDPFYPFYLPVGYFRIGWWDFHNHWRGWGSGHYWHSRPWFKHEMRADVRSHRMSQIRSDRSRGIDRSKVGRTGSSGGVSKTGTVGKTGKVGKTGTVGKTGKIGKTGTVGKTGSLNKTGTKTMSKTSGKSQAVQHGSQHSGQHNK